MGLSLCCACSFLCGNQVLPSGVQRLAKTGQGQISSAALYRPPILVWLRVCSCRSKHLAVFGQVQEIALQTVERCKDAPLRLLWDEELAADSAVLPDDEVSVLKAEFPTH